MHVYTILSSNIPSGADRNNTWLSRGRGRGLLRDVTETNEAEPNVMFLGKDEEVAVTQEQISIQEDVVLNERTRIRLLLLLLQKSQLPLLSPKQLR